VVMSMDIFLNGCKPDRHSSHRHRHHALGSEGDRPITTSRLSAAERCIDRKKEHRTRNYWTPPRCSSSARPKGPAAGSTAQRLRIHAVESRRQPRRANISEHLSPEPFQSLLRRVAQNNPEREFQKRCRSQSLFQEAWSAGTSDRSGILPRDAPYRGLLLTSGADDTGAALWTTTRSWHRGCADWSIGSSSYVIKGP
jgi:hypothetical protein